MNWGGRNFGFDSLKNTNHDMEEKGIVGGECLPLEGPPPEAEVPKRCPATIPFSSLSRFSLLHIDVDVEEPATSENPTRSFEIHNVVSFTIRFTGNSTERTNEFPARMSRSSSGVTPWPISGQQPVNVTQKYRFSSQWNLDLDD
ncbi:unnamed protein product [Boreogadus saida]